MEGDRAGDAADGLPAKNTMFIRRRFATKAPRYEEDRRIVAHGITLKNSNPTPARFRKKLGYCT